MRPTPSVWRRAGGEPQAGWASRPSLMVQDLTNTLTALVEGCRNRTPMLVIAGDTPVAARDHLQKIDQRAIVVASGCRLRAGPVRRHDRRRCSHGGSSSARRTAPDRAERMPLKYPVGRRRGARADRFPWTALANGRGSGSGGSRRRGRDPGQCQPADSCSPAVAPCRPGAHDALVALAETARGAAGDHGARQWLLQRRRMRPGHLRHADPCGCSPKPSRLLIV